MDAGFGNGLASIEPTRRDCNDKYDGDSSLIRYVVDANGEKTDVMIPVATWRKLLVSWKEVVELEEDKEDSAILQDWAATRAAGAWRRSRWMIWSGSCGLITSTGLRSTMGETGDSRRIGE